MRRRTYIGTLTATGLAGCLGSMPGLGDDDTHLEPPEQRRGDPSHPIHGDPFPDFAFPDPLTEETVSLDSLLGERSFLMAFIYTSCPDECGTLTRLLQLVQEDAADQGYADKIALLGLTFDPETDDAETLRDYGEQFEIDLAADNFHFLRPPTTSEALTFVNDEVGVPVTLESAHDHDHDTEEPHEHPDTTLHYYIMFLVNDRGIVERSYPQILQRQPVEIRNHVRTVIA